MNFCWTVGPLFLLTLTGCQRVDDALAQEPPQVAGGASTEVEAVCAVAGTTIALPDEVRETSGLAASGRSEDIFWTHNDAGNAAELFAVDAAGRLVQRIEVEGAQAVDWEDLESGRCDEGHCLFVGDIGDNDGERESVIIYRIPEPEPEAAAAEATVAVRARYPILARDSESLFRLPSGEMYLVTKGRRGPIELYRVPEAVEPGGTVMLERVRELFGQPAHELDRVTAATASPDGRWVAVRSYRNLYVYRTSRLTGNGEVAPIVMGLAPLGQAQGESVVLADDGTVWLSSEAANDESSPALGSLRCSLPAD